MTLPHGALSWVLLAALVLPAITALLLVALLTALLSVAHFALVLAALLGTASSRRSSLWRPVPLPLACALDPLRRLFFECF